MIKEIKSKDNKFVKETLLLKKKKEVEAKGLYLCEGFHMLEMALKARLLVATFSLEKLNIDESYNQYIVSEEILNKLSSQVSPQGVIFIARVNKEKPLKSSVILYLDGINDPGNMGTILRSALAFNCKDILVSSDSVSIYNEKALQASQGAIFSLNIKKCDAISLLDYKNKGYEIISTALSKDAVSLDKLKINSPSIIVFGNEANGVRKEIINMSNQICKINIANIDSLNVGVAAAIVMYEIKINKG